MDASTQLGCWSWPTLDPATLAAQFGPNHSFQGPPPSASNVKKEIKVESIEASDAEPDAEEMHLRSKRLSARSASAINIGMAAASSPKTNKRSRDSDEEYEDYEEASSSPKMGGKGKKTRDSYACLRHRAMHKRCPLDCADRRIPRPLPVATERKQIQELNQLRGVKLKSLSKLAKTTTIAAVAAALQKCKTPEEMEMCLAELPSSIPSSPTTPTSSQPQSRSTTPPPQQRGRKPKDKPLSASTSSLLPTGPMSLRMRPPKEMQPPAAACNLNALNLVTPQHYPQDMAPMGMTPNPLNLNNVQYMGSVQPVPFGTDAWSYGGHAWDSDMNPGSNKLIWDDLCSSLSWEESKLNTSGSNAATNAPSGAALDEILDFNCLNNEEEGSLSFDESEFFDTTNTNIYFNSDLNATNGGAMNTNPLNFVGDTDDLFASGSVSSRFQQINLASPSTPDLSATGSSNLTSPATDSTVFSRTDEMPHNNGDLQYKDLLPRFFLTREVLERWIQDPYFSKLVSGFFVMISLSPGDERIAQIIEARDLCYSTQAAVATSKALMVQYVGTDIRNMVMLQSVLNTLPTEQQMLRCLEQLKSAHQNMQTFEMEQKLNIINQRPRIQ
mmetsp:Transcript_28097/g.39659  ORF Transcript_28097/g.39659 Transcript_28097/m.39659 type:complete len:612 (-) Transcript_28097:87-1922(-)